MTNPTSSGSHTAPYTVHTTLAATVIVTQPQLEVAIRRHLSFVLDKAIKLHTDDEELTSETVQFTIDGQVGNSVLTDIVYDAYGHVHRVSLFGQDRDLDLRGQTSAGYVIVVEAFGVNDILRPRQVAYVVTFDGPTPVFANL